MVKIDEIKLKNTGEAAQAKVLTLTGDNVADEKTTVTEEVTVEDVKEIPKTLIDYMSEKKKLLGVICFMSGVGLIYVVLKR